MLYNKSKIVIEHINYKNNINFEEMITIYKNKNDTNPKPIFVFLMGSAWLGHIPFLYFITNYWNSSIMKNLSNKGYTCISIRHRGTFFSPIYFSNIYSKCFLLLLFFSNFILFINILFAVFLWNKICINRADFTMIKSDVEKSIQYIDNNYNKIQEKYNGNGKIILAGYSSGVQVLHTCLISNYFSHYKNINIKNIIYISGVINLFNNLPQLSNSYVYIDIINKFLNLIFSKNDVENNIVTPYDTYGMLPINDYYIIGCKNEFLNIPFIKTISSTIFCGKIFNEYLNKTNKSTYIEFNKNHWNILNSTVLTNTIIDIIEK